MGADGAVSIGFVASLVAGLSEVVAGASINFELLPPVNVGKLNDDIRINTIKRVASVQVDLSKKSVVF